MRAQWNSSCKFETGVKEVVGCVWEMQIVCYETDAWANTMLGKIGTVDEELIRYLESSSPDAEVDF
jgi:hypothetical protein